jgi:cell division protein FtsB
MKKDKEKSLLKPKLVIMLTALFLIILILTFFFGEGGFLEIVDAQKRIANHEKRIAELENEKKKLTKIITELKTNPLALEKTAREKLWLMKDNEIVVVIIKNKKQKIKSKK